VEEGGPFLWGKPNKGLEVGGSTLSREKGLVTSLEEESLGGKESPKTKKVSKVLYKITGFRKIFMTFLTRCVARRKKKYRDQKKKKKKGVERGGHKGGDSIGRVEYVSRFEESLKMRKRKALK